MTREEAIKRLSLRSPRHLADDSDYLDKEMFDLAIEALQCIDEIESPEWVSRITKLQPKLETAEAELAGMREKVEQLRSWFKANYSRLASFGRDPHHCIAAYEAKPISDLFFAS
jgi:hypothetical protein